jgi:hypothetical protein
MAWFPPLAVDKLASTVNTPMDKGIDQCEVLDAVILPIFVDVMDAKTIRHGAVISFPNKPMFKAFPRHHIAFLCYPTGSSLSFFHQSHPHCSANASAIP